MSESLTEVYWEAGNISRPVVDLIVFRQQHALARLRTDDLGHKTQTEFFVERPPSPSVNQGKVGNNDSNNKHAILTMAGLQLLTSVAA